MPKVGFKGVLSAGARVFYAWTTFSIRELLATTAPLM